ncbi:MAG: hypothetical protein ABIN01_15280 [Ferruginibacter sp.]
MKLKAGKEEIIYLLQKVFEKYESETGDLIIRNTNRKNYEAVSKKLSEISNELPNTAEALNHDTYSPDYNPNKLDYPSRKYDITASQVKDASLGLVNNPRPFLIDACYIYLFGIGRKGFEKNPVDEALIRNTDITPEKELDYFKQEHELLKTQNAALKEEKAEHQKSAASVFKRKKKILLTALFIAIAAMLFSVYKWVAIKNDWQRVKKDLNILPYQPTQLEIDSLEGIWLCYTGSPQARVSDPNRYHMVVPNVLEVKYKNGYFTFTRYGANFDHSGYMQYQAPWLISIHSYVKNNADSVESPRHSLMRLDKESALVPVISASWSFDVGDRNNIIGIREVYIKQGKGGTLEEVINTIENASCKCKIIKWHQHNNVKVFYIRNELLDTLPDEGLKSLINEKSILLRVPQEGLIITHDSISKQK